MYLIKYNYKIDYEAVKSPLTHWFSSTDCHYLAVPKIIQDVHTDKICGEITWLQSLTADDTVQYVHRQPEWEGRKKQNITTGIYGEN